MIQQHRRETFMADHVNVAMIVLPHQPQYGRIQIPAGWRNLAALGTWLKALSCGSVAIYIVWGLGADGGQSTIWKWDGAAWILKFIQLQSARYRKLKLVVPYWFEQHDHVRELPLLSFLPHYSQDCFVFSSFSQAYYIPPTIYISSQGLSYSLPLTSNNTSNSLVALGACLFYLNPRSLLNVYLLFIHLSSTSPRSHFLPCCVSFRVVDGKGYDVTDDCT